MGVACKKLAVFVAGSIIVRGIMIVAANLLDGKDILGRAKAKKPQKKTTVDWKGHIILGTEDGWIA